ncbi:MAG: type II toxin-antitoxin system RelE/ParE family toxin [Pseudomonadota bacterium]|nr:type II toxin-antitoxin system RelE/ParE family toxin [Pseudomonadota bacterium]
MTTYELEFLEDALKEWRKLDSSVRNQFSRKLSERLANPRIPSARLSGMRDCYKIKLRKAGYRLVYQVFDRDIVVLVVPVGRREQNKVYRAAAERID